MKYYSTINILNYNTLSFHCYNRIVQNNGLYKKIIDKLMFNNMQRINWNSLNYWNPKIKIEIFFRTQKENSVYFKQGRGLLNSSILVVSVFIFVALRSFVPLSLLPSTSLFETLDILILADRPTLLWTTFVHEYRSRSKDAPEIWNIDDTSRQIICVKSDRWIEELPELFLRFS